MTHPLQKNDYKKLVEWFEKNQRDLPWRKKPDPYWVWVAEIMSQQTQMAALVPYFFRFIEKFPTVRDLAQASEPEVLSAWSGLGYYTRARNLHRTAKEISFELKGAFPTELKVWQNFSGVGPYTAAAIVSQCFKKAEPVWDGNVLRVWSRLLASPKAREKKFQQHVLEILRSNMKGLSTSAFNQSWMELGALVCTPKSPKCGVCPLSSACVAYQMKSVEKFPPPKEKKEFIELKPKVWIFSRQKKQNQEVFLLPRKKGEWYFGLWDFPSELGGVRMPIQKLVVRTKEQVIGKAKHGITHHKIELQVSLSDEGPASIHTLWPEGKWLDLDGLTSNEPQVPLATTAKKTLRLLNSLKNHLE